MIYAMEMVSDGMKYMTGFMTIDSGIQVIFRLLPREFYGFQCWYY
jgi:hypothetical protein